MEYVQGLDFFTLFNHPNVESYLRSSSADLCEIYSRAGKKDQGSATSQIGYTEKYKKYGPESLNGQFASTLSRWEDVLSGYPGQLIHNDLNSANTLVQVEDGSIRAIDPRADVQNIEDVAKDVGRVLASATSAAYGKDKSSDFVWNVADAITSPWENWDEDISRRVAFYLGQSYLSFSRWPAKNFTERDLFNIGWQLLQSGPNTYPTMKHLTDKMAKVVVG
jgi:hypothetical protein